MRTGFLCLLAIAWIVGHGVDSSRSQRLAAAEELKSGSSLGQSISDGFKGGVKKLSHAFSSEPQAKAPDDPISLNTKSKLSPEFHISMGLFAEQQGKLGEAEQCYQHARKLDRKHLGAMIAYARFKDRQNEPDEALKLYQEAAKLHPSEAIVFNDLGLFYARRQQLKEALVQLERAVQLKPHEALYRNNIATVLTELGDPDRAFEHLLKVHREAEAYYNLGYLMQKKGQTRAAMVFFTKALESDPSLVDARIWVERLGSVASRGDAPPPIAAQGPYGRRRVATAGPQAVQRRPQAAPAIAVPSPDSPIPARFEAGRGPDRLGTRMAGADAAPARPPMPVRGPLVRGPAEVRQLPPVSREDDPVNRGMPSDRLENAPLPPDTSLRVPAEDTRVPPMAPLPPDQPLPAAPPRVSIGEVIPEP